MLHSKNKFRELFRFFERLSFFNLKESLRREGLKKTNSRANEAV